MAAVYILLSAAMAGFLIWNFLKAKIFMGDSGGGFLGLMLGAFALYSAYIASQIFWMWLILLGVFVVDATYTLVRRLLRGDRVNKAHRCHAYQYASRKYNSHLVVTLMVLMINLFWLTPWAIAVAFSAIDGTVGTMCAYFPLLWLVWYFHAGELEKTVE